MNADPRRPDKVQRYVPAQNNANGEDLTPDYMNIMGQPATTANAAGEAVERAPELNHESNHLNRPDDVRHVDDHVTTNATNVIPTSSQYGVAIIPSNISGNDMANETPNLPSDTTILESAKPADDNKDIATPSRNDRFKVVKIASLEPFKRGRWKCMDYVDEAPPPNVINPNITKQPQSVGSNTSINGGVYLQTQSLPQQQIQQMLLQGGFTNGTQFFSNVPVIPQGQYFYPQVQGQSMPQQVSSTMPAQFMNNQQYFAAGVMTNPAGFTLPQSYPNIQYVPIPAQNSAFVPTSQSVHIPPNFQQSQSYTGQPNIGQTNSNPSMMNGHAYPSDPQLAGNSMPNQPAKNMISNNQPVNNQQNHVQSTNQSNPPQPIIQNQYQQSQSGNYQHIPQQQQNNQPVAAAIVAAQPPPQSFDVYTNPAFAAGVNNLPAVDSTDEGQVVEVNNVAEVVSESEDPNRSNPVVNAIDNKIEQAMDLVKSHLMYTVREEVEVLKEKIAELMEKIQQLETENNYLRSQIPKTQNPPPPTASNTNFSQTMAQPQNLAVNPSPNVVQAASNTMVQNPQVPTNPSSQNQPIPNQQLSKDPAPIQ